jgi:hypothetical protein
LVRRRQARRERRSSRRAHLNAILVPLRLADNSMPTFGPCSSSASKLPPLMQARAAGGQRLSALAALRGSKPAPSPTADGLKASVLAGHPGCTPADGAAGMTDGGSCHAYPVNPCSAYAASKSDLRDHAVRLRNRRRCHSLRRCRNRQGEASNSNQPDHSAPPLAAQSPGLVTER